LADFQLQRTWLPLSQSIAQQDMPGTSERSQKSPRVRVVVQEEIRQIRPGFVPYFGVLPSFITTNSPLAELKSFCWYLNKTLISFAFLDITPGCESV
jgi:hypothetical protein